MARWWNLAAAVLCLIGGVATIPPAFVVGGVLGLVAAVAGHVRQAGVNRSRV